MNKIGTGHLKRFKPERVPDKVQVLEVNSELYPRGWRKLSKRKRDTITAIRKHLREKKLPMRLHQTSTWNLLEIALPVNGGASSIKGKRFDYVANDHTVDIVPPWPAEALQPPFVRTR